MSHLDSPKPMNPFRAFFVSLLATLGVFIGIMIAILAILLLSLFSEKESFSSSVKILPDAQGNRVELAKETPILLEIQIKGEIGSGELTANKIESILLKSREDGFKTNRVKGILLAINSPGGSAIDSDIIYRLLLQYKERYKVPIYAYTDGLCASGGYLIACAADKILASDASLIGSVGVLSWPPFFNLSDLMNKVGVSALTISAGIGKDDLNPTRPWKEGESQNHKELIHFFYQRFTDIVSTHRPMLSKEKLTQDFGAKVFGSPDALEKGYIDAICTFHSDAIEKLALASGIASDKKYQVVTVETKEWYKKLFGDESVLWRGKIKHEFIDCDRGLPRYQW